MKTDKVVEHIVGWLKAYAVEANSGGFVVGVSGGIDSAVTSALCALTGLPTTLLNMPIHQNPSQITRSDKHIQWLEHNHDNVNSFKVDLSASFDAFCEAMPVKMSKDLANANSRSRMRMVTLYAVANEMGRLVAGTGNKVEDHGVRFFTKYGDGGVDLSPIADLKKSEVYDLGRYLGVLDEILEAAPTDGLWDDGRTDEDQIGASYAELEWALDHYDEHGTSTEGLDERQKAVLAIYSHRHVKHVHKMEMPPACEIPADIK